jgi:hypothetical protein
MSASSDPELLARLVGFVLALERDASEIVEEFGWGRLVYNPKTAAMWSDNYLEVHSAERDARPLAELADQVLAPRGIKHRFVMPLDPADGQRLLPGFRELGGCWEVWSSVYMVRTRELERPASDAKEVSREETEAMRLAVAENDPDLPREAVEQRLIRDARMDRSATGAGSRRHGMGSPPRLACSTRGTELARSRRWRPCRSAVERALRVPS